MHLLDRNLGSLFGSILQRIQRPRSRLGIALDGPAVRLVRVEHTKEGAYSAVSYGEIDIDLANASALDQQRFRSAVRQVGGGITRAAVNVEHPTLRIRRMSFAKMPERDLVEAIRWNFREHVEVPIEQYTVGYTILGEDEAEGKITLMAYGLADEAVKQYEALMKSLGLKLVSLEPSSSAILAALAVNGILADGGYHVCVIFGAETTHFVVLQKESLLFCRPLAGISTAALLKLLMRNLNMEEREAIAAMTAWIERGMTEREASSEEEGEPEPSGDRSALQSRRIEMTTAHYYSQMVIELQRSIDAFCIMYGVDRVDAIHVCGPGIFYPGVVGHLEKTLGLPTTVFDPFAGLEQQGERTEAERLQAPLFGVALGLAIP